VGKPLVRLQQRARTGDGSFLLLGASIPFETIQMEYNSVTCKVYLLKRSSSLETFFFFSNGKILVQLPSSSIFSCASPKTGPQIGLLLSVWGLSYGSGSPEGKSAGDGLLAPNYDFHSRITRNLMHFHPRNAHFTAFLTVT